MAYLIMLRAPPRRHGPLLQLELDEEQRVVRERLLSWPLQRLQAEGLVLVGMGGRKQGAYFGGWRGGHGRACVRGHAPGLEEAPAGQHDGQAVLSEQTPVLLHCAERVR